MNEHGNGVSAEMKAALEAVGFEEIDGHPGVFRHQLIDVEGFDFSALSVQGAIQWVFAAGVERGCEEAQASMKRAIGIE